MNGPSEAARRIVHLGVGALAILLRYLTPWQAACFAAAAVLFNRFVLATVTPSLFRAEERRRPWRSGIVIYPVAVLLLIVLFRDRMEVAAAAWGLLAAGDSSAGVIGRRYGRRPIPWNHSKSLIGMAAFALGGSAAAWGLLVWMGRGPLEAALLAVPAGFFGSFVESLPWGLDDNLTVPLLSALFLRGLLEVDPTRLASGGTDLRDAFLLGVLLNIPLAYLARRAGTVDRSGMVAGFVVGVATYTFAGGRGFLVLLSFFVLGSAATFLGYRRKLRAGTAQGKGGARSARHALANCGTGVYLAFLLAFAATPSIIALAYVCAYATAAFDTVSNEVGQLYGGRPFLITTLRPVAAGTDGAVSFVGTLAGVLAAAAVGWVAEATGLLRPGLMPIAVAAAFVGSTVDSVLGATLEARGLMGNHEVNFSNTLAGALTGIGLAVLVSAPV